MQIPISFPDIAVQVLKRIFKFNPDERIDIKCLVSENSAISILKISQNYLFLAELYHKLSQCASKSGQNIIAEFKKGTFDWLKPADIDSVNLLSVIQD